MNRMRWAVGASAALGVGALLTASLGWSAAGPGSEARQELPEGVTAAMIALGDSIFHGPGFCYTCHGPEAKGVPQLGSDLTDDEWTQTDGTYPGLVERVTDGVTAENSSSGIPMPPKGGARLSDEQVQAVAAYVWTLSRDDS